jgi:CRISPR/Cas system Type II protein with McrA/HNH and RuvC-like nuclease domain
MNTNDKVRKLSGKPFKSQLKINTIKEITVNEQDPKKNLAAKFYEDNSVVSLNMLELVT